MKWTSWPRLNYGEIENMDGPINNKKIKPVIKNFPT